VAPSSHGINLPAYTMSAFVIGALIAGLAGGLETHINFFVDPTEYGTTRAVQVLTFAVVGGATNVVAVRMRQQNRIQMMDARSNQKRYDNGLANMFCGGISSGVCSAFQASACVDQQGVTARRADEDRIRLADVEHRDFE